MFGNKFYRMISLSIYRSPMPMFSNLSTIHSRAGHLLSVDKMMAPACKALCRFELAVPKNVTQCKFSNVSSSRRFESFFFGLPVETIPLFQISTSTLVCRCQQSVRAQNPIGTVQASNYQLDIERGVPQEKAHHPTRGRVQL